MLRTWTRIAVLFLLGTLRPAGPALGAGVASAPAPVPASELVFGNGTPGPFALSWTQVQFGSERLSVNGTPLIPDLDYRLDCESGAITFAQSLQWGQIALVEYRYDASQAKSNHGPVPVPLLMRAWESRSGSLQFIGAMQPAPAAGSTPSPSVLRFRGETALGGSQFSTLFLLAPEANGPMPANRWQRAALQFGASRTTGPFQFRATLGQAGSGFDPANDYQLQPGLRTLDLSAALNPSKRISFTSQVKRQDALEASQKGNEQASITNQLTLAPASGTKLTISQESDSQARPQGAAETIAALSGRLEQQLGSGTVATLLAQRRRTDSTGTTTTTGIDLASHLAAQTRLTAGFVQNDNDRQGRDSTAHVGLDAQAAPQLTLRTSFSHRDSAKDGRTDALDFGLDAGRKQTLALEGSYTRSIAAKSGSDATSRLALTLRPAGELGFHIGLDQHFSTKQGNSSGTDWGVTAGRQGLLAVEGQSTQTLAVGGQSQQQEQLRVEASPLRGLKVAELTATELGDPEAARETRETSLELSPLRALNISGALRDEGMADGVTHIRSVSGGIKPAPFLDLSGAYKTRDLPAGDTLVTRDVQLALIPVRGFKIQGSYVENPEDLDGHVLPTTDTSLGLESTIGSLAFGGSYTVGEGADPTSTDGAGPRQREQSEFRLALSLWGHSRLYSRYKEEEERTGSLTLNRTLSLGFTRSLSDHFYLLLEGEMTQVEVNGVLQPGMSDECAQARLALRF